MPRTKTPAEHLARPIGVYLSRNGILRYARKGEVPAAIAETSLLVFSVDTEEEAKELQVMLCKQTYDIPPLWKLPFPDESDEGKAYENLTKVTDMLKRLHYNRTRGFTGEQLVTPFINYKKELGLF